MKGILVIILAAMLVGCFEERPQMTSQQRIEQARQYMIRKEEFMHLCDTNGGVKYYNDHGYCGRGCSRPSIECNNGLSATFNR
jgi:hypothetical protein